LLRLGRQRAAQFRYRRAAPERIMPKPKDDKHKVYARYAARCLEMTAAKGRRDDREVLREMTAEWLKLADAIVHPLKPMKKSGA
jgi:hypothetical protein